jgi:hypothetical protein
MAETNCPQSLDHLSTMEKRILFHLSMTEHSTRGLSLAIGLPTEKTRRFLQFMAKDNIVKMHKARGGRCIWCISPKREDEIRKWIGFSPV